MHDLYSLDQQLPIFQALSSELRIQIMNLILSNDGINFKQIAAELGISVSTLSPHISRLEECGLIKVETTAAVHGTQKRCFPAMMQLIIDFDIPTSGFTTIKEEIPIGTYTDFFVTPTCGLATDARFLGSVDEPRSFTLMDRYQAGIIWFTTGYLEYTLPNSVPTGSLLEEITLSFELASEAPRWNNVWPSDIEFFLNGTKLGMWTCPGDFGDRRGDLNPAWWYSILNQYGMLKTLTINHKGTWMDDELLSPVTLEELGLTDQSIMKFRMQVSPDSEHPGGLTLYGRGYGDHNQHILLGIKVRL